MKNLTILVIVSLIIVSFGQVLPQPQEYYLPGVDQPNPTKIFYVDQYITATKCIDYKLNAGNNFMDYGTVRVCNTQYELYVGIYADNGFIGIDAIKMWFGTSLSLLPMPKKGDRPAPGQFPFKSPQFQTREYYWSLKILFSDISKLDSDPKPLCSVQKIIIYVHVDCFDNTCWGGGSIGTNPGCVKSSSASPWYCTIEYKPLCPVTPPPTPPQQIVCEREDTAYAFGNYILYNMENPNNLLIADPSGNPKRWGWAYKSPNSYIQVTFDIWAGAGQNDVNKGYDIGQAHYVYNPSTKTGSAKFDIQDTNTHEFLIKVYQVHIADSPPNIFGAPGTYKGCASSGTVYSRISYIECTVNKINDQNNDGIWFIAHFEVCKRLKPTQIPV